MKTSRPCHLPLFCTRLVPKELRSVPGCTSPDCATEPRQERGAPSEGCPRGGTGSWALTLSPGTRPCFCSLRLSPQHTGELQHGQLGCRGLRGCSAAATVGLCGAALNGRESVNERCSGETGCPGFLSMQFFSFSLLRSRLATKPSFPTPPPSWSLSVLQTLRAHYR